MEDKTYMIHPIGGKSILRSTGGEIKVHTEKWVVVGRLHLNP